MNTDLMLEIAERIEAQPDLFDLTDFFEPKDGVPEDEMLPTTGDQFVVSCNTTACVAGWAIVVAQNTTNYWEMGGYHAHHNTGRDLLGLTEQEANYLFYAGNPKSVWQRYADEYGWDWSCDPDDWSQITGYQAADVLKRIAKGDIEL